MDSPVMTAPFIAYITITVIGILSAFFLEVSRKWENIKEGRLLFDCPVCAYRYIIDSQEIMHTCPQCNSINKT